MFVQCLKSRTFKVKKQSTLLDLYKTLADEFKLNVDDIRVWSVLGRYNGTIRPLTAYDVRNTDLAHRSLPDVSKQDSVWTIFVERVTDLSFAVQFDYVAQLMSRHPSSSTGTTSGSTANPLPELSSQQIAPKLPVFKPEDEVMIFFKFYDPKTSIMRYVFRMYLSKNWTLSKLSCFFNCLSKQTILIFLFIFLSLTQKTQFRSASTKK